MTKMEQKVPGQLSSENISAEGGAPEPDGSGEANKRGPEPNT